MKINYTFIIPHKNIPELLKKCLGTIPKRSDVQIIIIDDKSDDKVVDFDAFPGLGEQQVEIIFSKEGKGAGHARNLGLKEARGKWLIFADADDYFVDDFLKYTDKFLESDSDIIFFPPTSINLLTGGPAKRHCKLSGLINNFLSNQNIKTENDLRFTWYSPCSKMVKNNFVKKNNIKFEEVIVGNDVMFSILSGYFANNIEASPNIIYTISNRPNSLINTFKSDYAEIALHGTFRANHFMKKRGILYSKGSGHLINVYRPYLGEFWAIKKMFFSILNKTPINDNETIADSLALICKNIYGILSKKIYQKIRS